MSLESFSGFESGEGMSESAFEAFKEKMKAAAAQIAAIKKEENKQKRTETDLLKILLKFVAKSQKKRLVLLIARALEQNIPANFILGIILLGNEDIKREVESVFIPKELKIDSNLTESNAKALIFFGEDETLPLKQKIEMDAWIKILMMQAGENPQKLLKTSYFYEKNSEEKKIKEALIDLTEYVVRDFLKTPPEKSENFAKFLLKGILKKTEENLEQRRMLDNNQAP